MQSSHISRPTTNRFSATPDTHHPNWLALEAVDLDATVIMDATVIDTGTTPVVRVWTDYNPLLTQQALIALCGAQSGLMGQQGD